MDDINDNATQQEELTLEETQADVGTVSITVNDFPVDPAPVAPVKPVFEYVQVNSFLPIDPITVGKQAYIKVLGPSDTADMVSTVPVFTQPVTTITENGFETDDATYVEVQ